MFYKSSSSNAYKSPNIIALLDVDKTVILGTSDYDDTGRCIIPDRSINHALITSLKEHNITQVYLFTDMTFTNTSISERTTLVNYLQNQGFKVLGVITPPDCGWSLDQAELKALCDDLDKKQLLRGPEETLPARKNQITENPHYIELNMQFSKDKRNPQFEKLGQGFSAVTSKDSKDDASSAVEKSMLIKMFVDAHSIVKDLDDPKGVMFEYFLSHKPQEMEICALFDDKPGVHKSVLAINDRNRMAQMHVIGVQVNKDTDYSASLSEVANIQMVSTLLKTHTEKLKKSVFGSSKQRHKDAISFSKIILATHSEHPMKTMCQILDIAKAKIPSDQQQRYSAFSADLESKLKKGVAINEESKLDHSR